jgi:hypothetical protein
MPCANAERHAGPRRPHGLAKAAFDYLPHRAALDLAGWEDVDIFAHS